MFFPLAIPNAHVAGTQSLRSGESLAMVRDGRDWLVFNPDQPEGPDAAVRSLPESAAATGSSLSHDFLYANKGREIWRIPRKGGEWARFFTAPWAFHAFHVVDDRRVILAWVSHPEEVPGSGTLSRETVVLLEKPIKKGSQVFLEDWDAETQTLKQRVPMPGELSELLPYSEVQVDLGGPCAALPLGRLWLLGSDDHLLVYVDGLYQLYRYDLADAGLHRMPVPWKEIDAAGIETGLRKLVGQRFRMVPFGCPGRMSVSPLSGGGFRFAWWEQCPTEKAIQGALAPMGGPPVVVPGGVEVDPSLRMGYRFRFAEWMPGKTSVAEIRHAGILDLNDAVDPEVIANRKKFSSGGIFMNRDRELKAYPDAMKMIRAALERRAQQAAKTAGKTGDPVKK